MLDFNKLSQYKENNRLEAKKALGGLPNSIWETYSAFANTLGGLILLGVVEDPEDHSFKPIDLPEPERLMEDFWEQVNDPARASANILSGRDVYTLTAEDCRIVVIDVPPADRRRKPVYVDGDIHNSYRRNGEGDYRCTREELEAMQRDAALLSQDMRLLPRTELSALDGDSLRSYRRRMQHFRPGHVWEILEDPDFLEKLGAAAPDEDGTLHPTAAGLLMFGREAEIRREFPGYSLEYRECAADGQRDVRIRSDSRDWSGNVYDFYFRVSGRLARSAKVSAAAENGENSGDPVQKALLEALANCLINADYRGTGGVTVRKEPERIILTNPGSLRIGLSAALSGGTSDARNAALQSMFSLIDVGERTGSGIPRIFRAWRERQWAEPEVREAFEPDRVILTLIMGASSAKSGRARPAEDSPALRQRMRDSIVACLTDRPEARVAELSRYTGLTASRTRTYLKELIQEDYVEAVGPNRARSYRLKQ